MGDSRMRRDDLPMRKIIAFFGAAFAILALLTAAVAPAAADSVSPDAPQPARPILLELFTSQGCSSCPPADALLGELAERPEILALSYHVDYWDDLGWVDRLASPDNTHRQQAYSSRHGFELYTPQLVVDGQADAVGSDRSAVVRAIAHAAIAAVGAPASIRRDGAAADIALGTVPGTSAEAGIYLLSFDPVLETAVHAGENGGRKLQSTNVVRSRRRIGEWHNQAIALSEPLRPGETGSRLAVIVQDRADRVWSAAATPTVPPPKS
jgi:hypothetical protein